MVSQAFSGIKGSVISIELRARSAFSFSFASPGRELKYFSISREIAPCVVRHGMAFELI